MTLRELLAAAGIEGGDASRIVGVTVHPERAGPGIVYVAIDTPLARGHARLRQAIKRGASALIVEHASAVPASAPCPVIVVPDSKRALAVLSARFYGDAHRKLKLWAVTGTKGKTTVCHLLHSILQAGGTRAGLIATKHQRFGNCERSSAYTTPEAPELHHALRQMVDAGATDAVVEASSMGIAFDRMYALEMSGAVFTNLGRDHLATHGSVEAYKAAKARLFTDFAGRTPPLCVVNVDDPWGKELAAIAVGRVVTYGLAGGEIRFDDLELGSFGLAGQIAGTRIESPLFGRHNAYNVLAAFALAASAGWPRPAIIEGIRRLGGIAGRMERIDEVRELDAFVDYAHTPESVSAALETLRELYGPRRIVAVLGCSGGTDPTKRPEMARCAVERADRCVFTADNPRFEDPRAIADEMVGGLVGHDPGSWEVELDRGAAIERGVQLAWPDGVLAVLGKGDETVQEVEWDALPFDDRAVLRAALKARARR